MQSHDEALRSFLKLLRGRGQGKSVNHWQICIGASLTDYNKVLF
jgi:hypothetical protein